MTELNQARIDLSSARDALEEAKTAIAEQVKAIEAMHRANETIWQEVIRSRSLEVGRMTLRLLASRSEDIDLWLQKSESYLAAIRKEHA